MSETFHPYPRNDTLPTDIEQSLEDNEQGESPEEFVADFMTHAKELGLSDMEIQQAATDYVREQLGVAEAMVPVDDSLDDSFPEGVDQLATEGAGFESLGDKLAGIEGRLDGLASQLGDIEAGIGDIGEALGAIVKMLEIFMQFVAYMVVKIQEINQAKTDEEQELHKKELNEAVDECVRQIEAIAAETGL